MNSDGFFHVYTVMLTRTSVMSAVLNEKRRVDASLTPEHGLDVSATILSRLKSPYFFAFRIFGRIPFGQAHFH